MSHWAAPGVKCVSLNSEWLRGDVPFGKWLALRALGLPIQGGTYVVAAVGVGRGTPYIRLRGFGSVWWCALLFRPLVDPKVEADLALFTPLLDTNRPLPPDPATKVAP